MVVADTVMEVGRLSGLDFVLFLFRKLISPGAYGGEAPVTASGAVDTAAICAAR